MRNLFLLALLVGSTGTLIFFAGVGLGKLFNVDRKIQERGLDNPHSQKLSFTKKMHLFLNNPDVFIPFCLILSGAAITIIAIIIFIAGVLQKFLV